MLIVRQKVDIIRHLPSSIFSHEWAGVFLGGLRINPGRSIYISVLRAMGSERARYIEHRGHE